MEERAKSCANFKMSYGSDTSKNGAIFIVCERKLFYIADNILRYDFGHALAKCLKIFVHQHRPSLVYVHIYDFVY